MKFLFYIMLLTALVGCGGVSSVSCGGSQCTDGGDVSDEPGDGGSIEDTDPGDNAGDETDSGDGGDTSDSDSGDPNDPGTDDNSAGGGDGDATDDSDSGDGDTGTGDSDDPDIGGGDDTDAGNGDDTDNGSGDPGDDDNSVALPIVSDLSLNHRSGQTFVTWDEPAADARYHVYRSTQPINTDNLDDAELLTWRWGALDADTSRNKFAVSDVPDYFVIDDLGAPLSDSTGLFVHTTSENDTAHYAVTTIVDGVENRAIEPGGNTGSVQEFVNTPQSVLTLSVNGGKGRLYTQYMDYQQWNPTLNGYAFNYFVALPYNYDPSRSYPLQLELHAYGNYPTLLEEVRYLWQVVQLMPIDPGDSVNTRHTWWYGHARDHNYHLNGDTPFDGAIENFTEQRVMKAVQEITDRSDINIDAELTHAYGNSMGASGSVSLGLRYANVFSGIYASQPMMNYATSTRFRYNFERLFGPVENNLPVVNRGPYSEAIQNYGEGGSQPTGVWDWMNHHAQVQRRRGDDFAFMMIDFGKADDVIDWYTQGEPTFSAFADARVAYTATAREGVGHEWRAFDSVNENLYRFETGNWRYPSTMSYPGLHYASGSGRLYPPVSGDDVYQTSLEWSTSQYGFGEIIVDQSNRYEITLRSLNDEQQVDVTPRNTHSFRPSAWTECAWTARDVNSGSTDSGTAMVDGSGLLTVPQVSVVKDGGTRLVITCD